MFLQPYQLEPYLHLGCKLDYCEFTRNERGSHQAAFGQFFSLSVVTVLEVFEVSFHFLSGKWQHTC